MTVFPLFSLFLMLLVPVQSLGDQNDVTGYGTMRPLSKGGCQNFVVQAGPTKVVRGRVSGRTCPTKAIQA